MPLPFILAIRKSAGSWFAGETPRLYFYTIKATSDCLHIQRIRNTNLYLPYCLPMTYCLHNQIANHEVCIEQRLLT